MANRHAKAIPILVYHRVSPNPGPLTVSPLRFEAQMRYLVGNGYTALRADQIVAFIDGKARLPRKSVLITFDDGYFDNYAYAFPILKRLGLHAVIFAVTGWLGDGPPRHHAGMDGFGSGAEPGAFANGQTAIREGRADAGMLRWSEIKAMDSSGMVETHSHTHSHVHWDRQYPDDRERIARLEEDLAQSRAALREHLAGDSRHLCWPFGYYEPEYGEVAERAGFTVRYSVRPGACVPGTDPGCLPRVGIEDTDVAWFAMRIWIYSRPWINSLIRLRDRYAPSLKLSRFSKH